MITKRTATLAAVPSIIVLAAAAWMVVRPLTASSQATPPQLFTSVSNGSLASHGVVPLSTDPARQPVASAETEARIIAALKVLGLPTDLAEPPRLVRLREPIPGVPASTGEIWLAPLAATPHFSGGVGGFTPHPQSKGTYWVALYSDVTGEIVFTVAGEKVLAK